MKRPRFLLLVAIAIAVPLRAQADEPTLVPSSPSPSTSSTAEADLHFRQGVVRYKEQSFAAALVEFRKAYSILPDWRVLYDIGMTELELNDAAGAFTSLDRYLGQASGISEKRKAEVQAQLEKLKLRVGRLRVSVSVDGAEVLVDDLPVGKSPVPRPIVVEIGRRRVVASLPDGRELSRLVDVAAQEDVPVDFVIPPQPLPIPAQPQPASAPSFPPPPPATEPELSSSPAPFPEAAPVLHQADLLWVGYVTTGALLAGGILTGAFALGAKNAASSDASQFGVSTTSLDDANNRKHVLAGVADALFASAALAGGVTLYFALRHPGRLRARSAFSASWSITAGPTGAILWAAF
jgi:hypothetical protein